MTQRRRRNENDGAGSLNRREEEILRSVIHEHILSGEPIGSRTVSRGRRLDLSPASIRSIMAALEERGFLSQPHASAGRVPTDKAYRIYVDWMIGRPRKPPAQSKLIDRALLTSSTEIADLLAEASRQLSRFSKQVGVVLAPELARIVVEHVEFVRLEGRRVVAILVERTGVVHNRILEVPEPLEQAELDRMGRYLQEEFCGRTLAEIRDLLRLRMSEERARYDRWVAASLALGQQAVEPDGGAADVFVDGASNLLSSPEFADPGKVKSVLAALEGKRALVDLLGRVLEGEGLQVVLGGEQPAAELADCTLVASTYGAGSRVMGTLGIVGPTRMEYARAIALVDYLARGLSRFFTETFDE